MALTRADKDSARRLKKISKKLGGHVDVLDRDIFDRRVSRVIHYRGISNPDDVIKFLELAGVA